jgi:molybdate transport system substrate-binding protein
MRRIGWLISIVSVLLVLAGCGGDDDETKGDITAASKSMLTVYAAASLTEVFPTIDSTPQYNFAGSDDLAAQIREGAPADVYAAASSKYPQELFDEGLVEEPVTFASNRLVLIVPKDNPANIQSVDDLRNKDVKLVIGAEGVPIGDYTRTVLENMGATDVLDQVVSEEDDVKGVVGKVSLGEADAGFVYVTDVKPVEDKVTAIELPEEAQAVVKYEIAVVKDAPHHDAAHEFVEQVLSEDGQAKLHAAGFGPP